ncbi:MAG: transposase [Elusimicrobiota bacterium]
MPRQPRLNLPGLFYHVMVRGIERRRIFRCPADYLDFLRRLGDGLSKTGCRCFAWALMPNHLHLLLLSGVRGLVSLMHPLLTGYAVNFNTKYRRVGHLFQNRYKAIICEEDPYFLELVRYIGLQPVRAGFLHTPEELARYPWTSHPAIIGETADSWLEVDEVLSRFGSERLQARAAYQRFILDGWDQGYRNDLEGGGLLRSVGGISGALALRRSGQQQMADVRILGSGSFVEGILHQSETLKQTSQAMTQQWSLEELQQAIAEWTGVKTDELTSGDRRRTVAAARALFIFAAREWLGMTGAALGRQLGLSSGSLSKAFGRGRDLAQERQLLIHIKRKKGSNVPYSNVPYSNTAPVSALVTKRA